MQKNVFLQPMMKDLEQKLLQLSQIKAKEANIAISDAMPNICIADLQIFLRPSYH